MHAGGMELCNSIQKYYIQPTQIEKRMTWNWWVDLILKRRVVEKYEHPAPEVDVVPTNSAHSPSKGSKREKLRFLRNCNHSKKISKVKM